jgi:hypothetical protein
MRGYFFSLEALIAALVLLSAALSISHTFSEPSDKEARIFQALDALEKSGKLKSLSDSELEIELGLKLGFEVELNPAQKNGPLMQYLMVEGANKFRTVKIGYQLP